MKMMRVDDEFKEIVDEMADSIARELGIDNSSRTNRKISSALITKKLARKWKNNRDRGILL